MDADPYYWARKIGTVRGYFDRWKPKRKRRRTPMKNLLKRATLAVVLVTLPLAAAVVSPPVGDVTLAWSDGLPPATNRIFVLRGSPTLTGDSNSWPVLTNISGLSTQVTVRITPGQFYFMIQSSNLWGFSPPSNVPATPPLPLVPLLSIKAAQ